MITSEVQRTLVKSPPELWAELSDPTALARHLGELGEIRITRVDPEQRVEWETTGASGSVAIKPSGWGTRVTLTVQHEARADEQPTPSTPEPASGPSPGEAAGAPADSPPALAESSAALDASAESGAEAGPEPEPDPVDTVAPEPAAGDNVKRQPTQADLAEAEPVTALARWAAAVDQERRGGTGPAPEARVESTTEPAGTGEHNLDLHQAGAEQELLPRRGLLAWLLRRRRRHAGAETSPPGAAPTPAPDELPGDVATSAPGVHASEEPPLLEHLHEAPCSQDVAVAPAPAPAGDALTTGADGVAPGGEGPDVGAPRAATLDANDEAETSTTEADASADAEADADAQTSTADANAGADASAEVETSNPDAPGTEASPEEPQPLASGAGGGEQSADRGAEEVTAVLTAVLDRLGAAHHRPFSRG